MRVRLLTGLVLSLLALPLRSEAAVTSNQLITLCNTGAAGGAGLPFWQRVQFQLIVTAENIVAESAGTAKHSARAALASQVLNNPDAYTTTFGKAVVAQLTLSTTNMVTVNSVANADVDTTDTTIASDISAVFNDFLPQP